MTRLNVSNSRFSQAAAEESQRRQDEYSREAQSRLSRLQDARQQWKRDQLSPATLSRLDERVTAVKESDKLYRNYLDDKYGQNLTAPLRGIRLKAAKKATEEVTDPSDRQWLVGRIAEVGEARKFTKTQERAKAGYGKRFGIAAQEIGGAFADAGTEQLESFLGAGKVLGQEGRSADDISFLRDLEFANQSTNRNVSRIDTSGVAGNAIRLAQEAGITSAGMAPDMAAGLLAYSTPAGVGASTAYWTTRNLAERRDDFVELGMNEKDALLVGGASSLMEGAIENIIRDPSGMIKGVGVGRKLAGGRIKTLVREAGKQTLRFAGELLEESLQAATDEGMKYLAGEVSDQVQRRNPNEIHRRAIQAAREAAPGLGVMSLAFGGGNIASGLSQARMRTINNEIMAASRKGVAPSRRQWKRWTGNHEKTSEADRRQALSELAEGIVTLDRIETLKGGSVPTAEQWENWGMPPEEGKTDQDRLLYLNREYVVSAEEAAKSTTEATEAVAVDQPVAEPIEAPVAQEGTLQTPEQVQEAPGVGVLTAEATQTPPISAIEVSEPPTEARTSEVNILDAEKGSDSAVGNFIRDSAGRIGIDVEKAGRGLKKAKGIAARLALSRGELPQDVFKAKGRKEGFEAKLQAELGFAIKDFRKIEKTVFGKDGMNSDDMMIVKAALQNNDAAIHSLDIKIRPVLEEMRKKVDALSSHLRAVGAISGDLAAIIKGNEGVYLTTTYQAFKAPDWADNVPQEAKNAYADMIRKDFPEKTNEEIDGMIGKILYDAKEAGSPMEMISRAHLGATDLSILTPKKDLPAELRALLGEEQNPLVNYAESVSKIGNLIANQEFQREIKDAGGGEYFLKIPKMGTERGDMVAEIELDNETFYTSPELKAAIDREGKRVDLPVWLRHYMKANAAVKISKTVLSQQTQSRNTIANTGFAITNAHWRIGKIPAAWNATWAGLLKKGKKEWRDLHLRAVELQVVDQGLTAGELQDLALDAKESRDIEEHILSHEAKRASVFKKAVRGGFRAAAKAYQAGDNIWKIYGWLNEQVKYGKAFPNASKAEIEQKAAEIIKKTYPNYSLIPEGVKSIRRVPVVGSFVSFRSELIRTTYHTALLIREEIENPATRTIGYERLAGAITASLMVPSLAAALRYLYKVSKQDEEDLKYFLPDYQQNSTLAHTSGNVDGNFSVVDLTYTDPHGGLRQVWSALMNGDSISDAAIDATIELFEPFISDEILFAKLMEAKSNQKASGAPIYNEEGGLGEITKGAIVHIWDAFEPGVVTSGERFVKGLTGHVDESGKTYSAFREAGAMFLGQRVSDRDVRASLPFTVRKLLRRRTRAEGILTDVIGRSGKVSDAEIMEAFERSKDARKSVYTELKEVTDAAVRQIRNVSDVNEILKASGVKTSDRDALATGVYHKRTFTKAFLLRMRNANPNEYTRRLGTLRDAVENSLDTEKAKK